MVFTTLWRGAHVDAIDIGNIPWTHTSLLTTSLLPKKERETKREHDTAVAEQLLYYVSGGVNFFQKNTS